MMLIKKSGEIMKFKKILILLLLSIIFIPNDVSAVNECNDYYGKELCSTEVYKYSSDGSPKCFSFTLAVVHSKQFDLYNSNKQFIMSDDICNQNNNAGVSGYCATDNYRFDIEGHEKYIEVDSNNKVMPIAICALPMINNKPLNTEITSSNINNYVYFTASDVQEAINDGYCICSNVYYSLSGYSSSSFLPIASPDSIFRTHLNMEDANISAKILTGNVCSVTATKNNETYSFTHVDSNSCLSSSYKINCKKVANTGDIYSCGFSNYSRSQCSDNGDTDYEFCTVKDPENNTQNNSQNNSDITGDINWGDKVEVNCEGILGDELLDFINKIFRWIQIIAPIIVIVLGFVEFGSAVLQDDKDALKKASSKLIKRLIIAVALFFIPLILGWILTIFNDITGAASSTCGIGG